MTAYVLDNNILTVYFLRKQEQFFNPYTKALVPKRVERVCYYLDETIRPKGKARNISTRIVIPAPALGEMLDWGKHSYEDFQVPLSTPPFEIAPFDLKASVTWGQIRRRLMGSKGSKKPKQFLKFDDQILAIAASIRGECILVADDRGIVERAHKLGIKTVSCWEMGDPPVEQIPMNYPPQAHP